MKNIEEIRESSLIICWASSFLVQGYHPDTYRI